MQPGNYFVCHGTKLALLTEALKEDVVMVL